jgi:hypothetical protein
MGSRIIVVGANASLEPYKRATEETANRKAERENMGFEVKEEEPTRKIGFRPAIARAENK